MMDITITPGKLAGRLRAPASKSHTHRILIAAAMMVMANGGDGDDFDVLAERIVTDDSEDLTATRRCLKALLEAPVSGGACELDCGESGSTLRFLLPLSLAAGRNASFYGHGKLPERPLDPLDLELKKHGAIFKTESELAAHSTTIENGSSKNKQAIFKASTDTRLICNVSLPDGNALSGGTYTLPGHISSQYVTGLLMALPLLGEDSRIEISTPLQSGAYVDITLKVLADFGINITETKNSDGLPIYEIPAGQHYKTGEVPLDPLTPEGDWSNGAFWLVADALGSDIEVSGLSSDSPQGDKAISEIIRCFSRYNIGTTDAYNITANDDETIIDASEIPDLVPVISVLASLTPGTSRIVNAERLRIKESDRLKTTCAMLTALGGDVTETEDGLIINGKESLSGGTVDGAGDHRIVMSAAIAATCCTKPVHITGAQAVNKSYPRFFDDYMMLGGTIR